MGRSARRGTLAEPAYGLATAESLAIFAIDDSRTPGLPPMDLTLPLCIIVVLETFTLLFPILSRPSGVALAATGGDGRLSWTECDFRVV